MDILEFATQLAVVLAHIYPAPFSECFVHFKHLLAAASQMSSSTICLLVWALRQLSHRRARSTLSRTMMGEQSVEEGGAS